MTWAGEAASGVLVYYREDGTPGQIPLGTNNQILTIVGGSPVWATPASSSGSFSITETEVDFGSTPVANATFVVTNSSITASHKIIAVLSMETPTDKDQDELEMDNLILRCVASGGGFSMYINSDDGSYLEGKFKINYTYA